jgi:hypothetical protein
MRIRRPLLVVSGMVVELGDVLADRVVMIYSLQETILHSEHSECGRCEEGNGVEADGSRLRTTLGGR